ncbi:hypothetical protein BRADI_1g54860v3 [Brachypodium distachyon]|uniref:No apical meristem-associated C-terminal domain-containing protein n=1 Tax=Brachypodium distachyon TaxID=15368 RepID=A0A0Q3K7N5_BRADI|nr:hypothetical protein BRADI_1g54860v3 [Brachypodium distachyon]
MDPNQSHVGPDSPNHQPRNAASMQYAPNYPQPQQHTNPPQFSYGQGISPSHFLQNFHPFASPNNYQQYARPLAIYQGLQHQGRMGYSPHGVFSHAAAGSSPLLRPVSLFGGPGNTSSYGSQVSTPQSGREEPAHVEDVSNSSEEDGKKVVRTNWTDEENTRLGSSWIKHSVDSIDGNGKKAEYYWRQVAEEFNSNRPINGTKRSVKQGVTGTTREWYKGENNGKPFTMEVLWDILKEQPKWKNTFAVEKNKRTTASGAYASSSNPEIDVEPNKEMRPEGQKKAKERRKAKGKGALQPEDKPFEDMLLFHDAIGKRSAALVQTTEASVERTKLNNQEKLKCHEQALDTLGKQLFPENV